MTQTPKADPERAQALRLLAQDLWRAGDLAGAAERMRAAITCAPQAQILRLHLGQVLQQLGDIDGATRSYFLAVMKARAKGLWLDEQSIAPEIYPQVLDAMRFVESHRDEVLLALLEPLEARFGKSELVRVRGALEIYLGIDLRRPASALQKPLFMYVPGLRETPFLDSRDFAFTEQALDLQKQICLEAETALQQHAELVAFLQAPAGEDLSAYLAQSDPNASEAASWNAYFFYRHGRAFPVHLAACPNTAELLRNMPRVEITDHAPEICFSVLSPGAHILPHSGVSNSRIVVHLPLILPAQCVLKVAGIERAWQRQELLIFDDTFEHEAWNRSHSERVILLMDTWHPDLRASERIALAELVVEIGRFNRG